jgi:hypothetical protein
MVAIPAFFKAIRQPGFHCPNLVPSGISLKPDDCDLLRRERKELHPVIQRFRHLLHRLF